MSFNVFSGQEFGSIDFVTFCTGYILACSAIVVGVAIASMGVI